MKENMLEENIEKTVIKNCNEIDELLMKPFTMGWTREVVNRVITKNGTPTCDIYYFSPSGKRIRSLTEIKAFLTDGLSFECFYFKRKPLGLDECYETVRDARVRKKKDEKFVEKKKTLRDLKKTIRSENSEGKNDIVVKDSKRKEGKFKKSKVEFFKNLNEQKLVPRNEIQNKKKIEKSSYRTKKIKQKENKEKNINFSNKKKTKTKSEKLKKGKVNNATKSVTRRKDVLKKILKVKQTKQANIVAGKKILKKVLGKKVAVTSNQKLSKTKSKKEGVLKNKFNMENDVKNKEKSLKSNQVKSGNEIVKNECLSIEPDKKAATSDLKSIVKKNIGKYREMREKQKRQIVKTQISNQTRKIIIGATRTRSEPISKNKLFYLKPFKKGWRRELVFRTNCAKAGQQADVYYFHPNGKKLRSCREIAENLTHGLSIECFTFRKEPIGCGEPSEVVRNARSHQKNF